MKKFEIIEEGYHFATIEARTAESALNKAEREYPRRAIDYNLEPGQTSTIKWFARKVGACFCSASKTVKVG